MDLPILNQLEKIYPSQDNGAQAINKLVRNQNLIEQGIKDIQIIAGEKELQEILKQINVLKQVKETVTLTLLSGWTNIAGSTQIKFFNDGTFIITGIITGGAITSYTPIANLPTGYNYLQGIEKVTYNLMSPQNGLGGIYIQGGQLKLDILTSNARVDLTYEGRWW